MAKYYCTFCRYKFENKKDRMPAVCPFCSKERTLAHDKDAASLIKEVDEMN